MHDIILVVNYIIMLYLSKINVWRKYEKIIVDEEKKKKKEINK